MKITLAGQILADFDDFPSANVAFNGQPVIDVAALLRGGFLNVVRKTYSRGNESVTLAFTSRRLFTNPLDAQVFALTHFSSLIKQGLCQLDCGGPGGGPVTTLYIVDAILTGTPHGTLEGLKVTHSYSIVGAKTANEL